MLCLLAFCFLYRQLFFFKQKTAYEMRISDWSSDVCSSDLPLDSSSLSLSYSSQTSFSSPCKSATCKSWSLSLSASPYKIGRATCRERVCQYVWISVVAGSLKKKTLQEPI